ncbi:beta/alpha barrel domain-containing protein [Marinilabilia salmonicolor]|uniref:type 2 isopentenyl-diphosphate Delta-isomerase n=1 Tax=Marinilabilia salmonicolor TaxID=989 RepID=UPI00029ADAA6|nr:type 2 isopentenyl-diphosphate Delta-isomerase [Marinilabilia salmonicolor]
MTDRKKDHIDLAFSSRTVATDADSRFHYEPMLAAHHDGQFEKFDFAGKTMKLPIWVSSMTGGTQRAGTINRNLATACGEFGMGMGLGSCRSLLDDDTHFTDFDVRQYMGDSAPLYANLGIAQIEKLIATGTENKAEALVHKLQADGLIVHVNPLQEAFQPEGDVLKVPPIDTIEAFLSKTNLRIIVKEVGQGMGPASLQRLLALPVEAIEFGALGGTNFSKLELSRVTGDKSSHFDAFGKIGHTAAEMTDFVNDIVEKNTTNCQQLIISGGITNVPDGWYLTHQSKLKSVFGMGSTFLKHAMDEYHTLQSFVEQLRKALGIAQNFMRPIH